MKPLALRIIFLGLLLGLSQPISAQSTDPAADATTAAQKDQTADLLKAAEGGDFKTVMSLIEVGVPVDACVPKRGETALMNGLAYPEMVEYLMRKGANVNARDFQGSSILLHACAFNCNAAAIALLNAGADPNVGSQWNRFPLMYAAQNGNADVVAALLAHKADPNASNECGTALYWAFGANNQNVIKELVEGGADLTVLRSSGESTGLHYSLMGFAAGAKMQDIVQLFLDHGVDINQLSRTGDTPLMCAASNPDPAMINFLCDKGAKLDAQAQNGKTALMYAAQRYGGEVLAALLAHHPAVDLTDHQGYTALMWACASNRPDSARMLVGNGANIDIATPTGETALTLAGDRGITELVDFLKAGGAKVTQVHIIPRPHANPPFTPGQQWILGLRALYAQVDGTNPWMLGDKNKIVADIRDELRDSWNVSNRAQLLQALARLRDKGSRARFLADGAPLGAMFDNQFNDYVTGHPLKEDHRRALRASYVKWQERSGLAWDYCRYVNLIDTGVQAGYLDAPTAWPLLDQAGAAVQHAFSSWQEMCDNFLDAREIWAGQRDARFAACSQLLLDSGEKESPWNQIPWQTSLAAGN